MTKNALKDQQDVTGAASLYQAISSAMEDPGVNSINYLWDAQNIRAEPNPSPNTAAALQTATEFLNRAMQDCPPAVRASAQWKAEKLALEPDMEDLFAERFGTTTHPVELLTTAPSMWQARDQTLREELQKLLLDTKQKTNADLLQVWQATADILEPMGFTLEDTNQPNLKYAVPRTQPETVHRDRGTTGENKI